MDHVIFFKDDQEFEDICIHNIPPNWEFSEWYNRHVDEDTKIVILDKNSTILRRGGKVAGRGGFAVKINAYRINPLLPCNPDDLEEVDDFWV